MDIYKYLLLVAFGLLALGLLAFPDPLAVPFPLPLLEGLFFLVVVPLLAPPLGASAGGGNGGPRCRVQDKQLMEGATSATARQLRVTAE